MRTEQHTSHVKTFTIIFGLLLFFTFITVFVAKYIHFESDLLTIFFAMLIASFKAVLVVLFFMHLKYENPITWLYFIFPVVILFIMLGGVFMDNPYRVQLGDDKKVEHSKDVSAH